LKRPVMFGYLRFFLAFFVLISHMGVRFFGMNSGVTAVVIFYLLAGHVVAHLWDNVLPRGRHRLRLFYRDRLLRIMPMYLYVTALTLVFLFATGYGSPDYSWYKLLGNLAVVPVNYYMALDTTILTDPAWALIPTAWSLGAELQVYLILPFALVHKKVGYLMASASLGVYLLANAGVLHPDYFGYRLVPGVFFIFLIGACIKKPVVHAGPVSTRKTAWILWGAVLCMGVTFFLNDLSVPGGYTRETVLGICAGVPLVFFLARYRKNLPGNALLASLSYGVFLVHFLVIWFLDNAQTARLSGPVHVAAVTLGSTALAWIGVRFIERPVDRVRK